MTTLPPDIGPDEEIEVSWNQGDEGLVITIRLSDASIQLAAAYDAIETLPWLVASLPNIMEAVGAAMESQEDS